MKKLIIIITILLLFNVTSAFALSPAMLGSMLKPGAVCTLLIDESGNTVTTWSYRDKAGQKIKYTSPIIICQAKFKAHNASTNSYTVYLQVWSDINRAGTQYGGNSSSVTLDASSATWYTFTWVSNMPQPTGDYFIHIIGAGYDNTQLAFTWDPNAYEDTNYDFFNATIDLNYDLAFELWSMQ